MKYYWKIKGEIWGSKETCHPDYKAGELPVRTSHQVIVSTIKPSSLDEIAKKIRAIAQKYDYAKNDCVSRFFFLGVEYIGEGED